ncbi:nad-dependent protein deacetylase sirtuin-(6/7) family member [Anaeramoeba flamelloides]|uniref:protein acetyllysine N-acetyltransferase n=1 Tax=Anaeramoeba flamelloides TaxID=1746091 RepID=A0AAV7ZSI0_9EUKA|nr:nad-dependent protein deacetylase sirtuin-(6/7) family member [Anaeramoeba flamelloides]KAJ6243936.1 nad-dependent protein deacetylase sirtuin-(6/7) family member [Anaeramoeba flamelloides]
MSNEELTEHLDNPKVLKKKVKKLAKLIRNSNYPVIHTGAGVSTSAGIPDYRGPNGVWTCRDQGRNVPYVKKPWNLLEPTYCHMTISKLIDLGLVKHLISQNTDGLHVHSGVSLDKISELHGNTNKEHCKDCETEYFRPFSVYDTWTPPNDHRSGRKCENCGGLLYDTIINFGENLSKKEIDSGYKHSKKSDLSIVLGTSLKVTPAADLPMIPVKKKTGKMVIVNLQKTPLDDYASIRIFAKTDDVCKLLMKELEIPVLSFKETLELRAEERRKKLGITKEEEEEQNKKERKKYIEERTKLVENHKKGGFFNNFFDGVEQDDDSD